MKIIDFFTSIVLTLVLWIIFVILSGNLLNNLFMIAWYFVALFFTSESIIAIEQLEGEKHE